ncbi:MAG: hypothetical protein KDE31_22720, partial [Caldilineaceae bacterium]|nr:hypothetical protein [Caldilineaceae bacterium]
GPNPGNRFRPRRNSLVLEDLRSLELLQRLARLLTKQTIAHLVAGEATAELLLGETRHLLFGRDVRPKQVQRADQSIGQFHV